MAKIRIEDGDVIVHLSLLEKVAAMRGDVHIRRSAVASVRVVKNPFAEVEGIRFPDTGVPGFVALGTWQRRDGREFVCVYRGQPGVVVELELDGRTLQARNPFQQGSQRRAKIACYASLMFSPLRRSQIGVRLMSSRGGSGGFSASMSVVGHRDGATGSARRKDAGARPDPPAREAHAFRRIFAAIFA